MSRVISDSLSIEEDFFNNDEGQENQFLIMPDSGFKIIWDSVMGLLTVYSLLYTPVVIAFGQGKTLSMLLFEMFVDLFYIIDVILNFCVPFHNFEENLIKSYKLIALNYIKTWFIWDFLSCLPLGTIAGFIEYSVNTSGIGRNFLSLNQAARLAKFYRVLKISQLFRIMRVANNKEFYKVANVQFLDDLNMSSSVKRFVSFVLGFLLVSHVLACIWVFFGSLDGVENWIIHAGLNNYNNVELYLASVFFIWTTIFTIGYGDITPRTTIERVFVILLMFIGVLVYSFAVSSLGTILTSYDQMTKKYMKSLQMLNEIKRKHRVDDTFYDKLAKYLNYHYKSKPVEQFTFINELPPALKNTMLKKMYNDVIRNFKFLKFENEDFRSKVVLSLRPVRAFKKEYIIIENEYIEEFVLVRKGVLSVNLSYKYGEGKIMEVRRCEHFGDILMMAQQKSPVNLKVMSKIADLFYINKNDLVEISLQFPEIFDKIYLISTYNYLIMLELMEERIEKYEKEEKRVEALQKRDNENNIKPEITYISNSTLNTPNKNYRLVNSFKRVNKEDIENARREVQKIYEMKNNLAPNGSFIENINERLHRLTDIENPYKGISENLKENDNEDLIKNKNNTHNIQISPDKIKQNIYKLSNINENKPVSELNSDEMSLFAEKANIKIEDINSDDPDTTRYISRNPASDNNITAKSSLSLINLNVTNKNKKITNSPRTNDDTTLNQTNNNCQVEQSEQSDKMISRGNLNEMSNITSDSALSGTAGIKGKSESHNNFSQRNMQEMVTNVDNKKEFSRTFQPLKNPKTNSNKILRRMDGRYRKLFMQFEKAKRIKTKNNSFEIKIDPKNDTFKNLIEDLSPRKKKQSRSKSKELIKVSPVYSHLSDKHSSPVKCQKFNKKQHLSEILVSNIGQKVRSFVNEQKNPEKFFKNELKNIIDNYFEKESVEQLIRIGEVFHSISNKFNIENEYHKMFINLINSEDCEI